MVEKGTKFRTLYDYEIFLKAYLFKIYPCPRCCQQFRRQRHFIRRRTCGQSKVTYEQCKNQIRPQNPSKFCFSSTKVLREFRTTLAEEFRYFDGIAIFLFG